MISTMKIIVLGATGLVGSEIIKKLLSLTEVSEISVFTRRELSLTHPKLKVKTVNFDNITDWSHEIKGDILFSALGTTLKQAGSKEAQYLVDHNYQLKVAESAVLNGVTKMVLISSVNADPASHFFYLRMKGELEQNISFLNFQSFIILRPGPIEGLRSIPRIGEKLSLTFLRLMPEFLLTPGMKPVTAKRVAEKAVLLGLILENGIHIIGPKEIHS